MSASAASPGPGVFDLALRMGDNALILAQRVSAWCGHAPALEEDIAMANVGLDLIGQARLWLTLAGEAEGKGRSADDLAFLRDARAFRNALLVEQPNGDYGATLMRQFLFDAFHLPMLEGLSASCDARVAAIAQKAVKEARYHVERSRDLVVRLGDGSDESRRRMQSALDALFPFALELSTPDADDAALARIALAPDLGAVGARHLATIAAAAREASLAIPDARMRGGGKRGLHSEHLGFMLAEMQFLQRAYPGATW